MGCKSVLKILAAVAVVILVVAAMTVLSAVPPLSIVYSWAERNHVKFVWDGVVAGVAVLCALPLCRKKNR